MTGGEGTMGGEQVNYNRDLLKGNHSKGGHVPLVPPTPPPPPVRPPMESERRVEIEWREEREIW